MPNDREELTKALLETNNIFNKITAVQMNGAYNSNVFNVRRDCKILSKIEKKVYKVFLKLIVPEQAKKLTEIDELVDRMIEKVEDRTGWSITEFGAFKEDNFQNLDDYEFRSWDTYRVPRNRQQGFYVKAAKTNDTYEENIRSFEQTFYNENKATLDRIHELMSQKELIMSGNYTLKDPTPQNEKLATLISIYLNYQPSPVLEENKEENNTMSM